MRFWSMMGLGLAAAVSVGCASAQPPPASGPTPAAKMAYQEGRLDGSKAQREETAAALKAKDAEIAELKGRLMGAQLEGTKFHDTGNALQACTVDLATSRQRVADLEEEIRVRSAAPPNQSAATFESEPEAPVQQQCCKICHKGKACGNSCISRAYTCHKGPGCACDG